ncbi:MAG: Na+/H+ antiporter subunit E [Coriobacteriia bacterium]|nr:Na+/H+ antiporter subunit E [Coriobacteriia bacterium]
MGGDSRGAGRILPSLLVRAGALAFTWWVLTGGDRASLGFGIPVSLAAAVLSLPLAPPRSTGLRLAGVPPFGVYFITRSIAGGMDVARRALAPSMPIDPALVEYHISLTGTAPRVIFANTISLLPGTLSARIDGDALLVHALDGSGSIPTELRELESKVGALFGQRIAEDVGA